MPNIANSVMLIGHLGGDPEIKETANGKKLANVSIATNNTFKDKNGEKTVTTQWHRLVGWEGVAEYMSKYLQKGSHVAVLGKISYHKFVDKEGVNRNYAEIVVDEFKHFDKGAGDMGMPI